MNQWKSVAAMFAIAVMALAATAQENEPPGREFPQRLADLGIENGYQLSPRVYSSGQPNGDADFTALAKLGVKTVISVDGAPPDVATAKKHGLRYIHLPMGYDGVPPDQQLKIIRALDLHPGPVLIHCHHGKHRGPAAAAIACMADAQWSRQQSLSWLKQAGTAAKYRQLFIDIEKFRLPSAQTLAKIPAELPESVPPPPWIEAMIAMDGDWDILVAAEKQGFPPGKNQPLGAPDPAHTATQLQERLRELARSEATAGKPVEFRELLKLAVKSAETLEKAIASPNAAARDQKQIAAAMRAVGESCTACHAKFRDVKEK